MVIQRFQNPSLNSVIRLRLFTYNSNMLNNIASVQKVDIYFLDPASQTADNPQGLVLVTSIDGSQVIQESTGTYYVDLIASAPAFVIGDYQDAWTVQVDSNQNPAQIKNTFTIYPQLWYTTTTPIVYDFSFDLQPNRIPKGSIKYLRIQIIPSVPTATELQRYYTNLAISSNLLISISRKCDSCAPQEEDLRLIIDKDIVEQREKVFGFYKIDTTDWDCGLYDVWFQLNFGDSQYISDRYQLLVYG